MRFPDHARVVFIGDSITAGGLWIAHIFDHYLKNFPQADIRMYNSGISGGHARSALKYLDENILCYRPTHAVIMLGMNDIERRNYVVDEAGNHAENAHSLWLEALHIHMQNMRELVSRLQDKGIEITLITPTCFDESSDPRHLDTVCCDAALEYAGEFSRQLAAEIGADFINFHAPMRYLNACHPCIRADRVHPLEEGHVIMAHLFLAHQGLVPIPTPDTLSLLPAPDALLPVNQKRKEAEILLRRLWNAEWLLLENQPKDPAARKAFLESYSGPTPYWDELRDHYLKHGEEREAFLAAELACVEKCLIACAEENSMKEKIP